MSVDRGFTWRNDETIALIDIFSKSDIQKDLHNSKRNFIVYERISSDLSKLSFNRNANQCREKIKRLRKEYLAVKCSQKNTSTSKKSMKHFDLLESIFNKTSLPDESIPDLNCLTSDQEEELNLSSVYIGYDLESEVPDSYSEVGSILPGPSCSLLSDENSSLLFDMKHQSPLSSANGSEDGLLGCDNHQYNFPGSSGGDDNESLWVPNVVLVENDLENDNLGDSESVIKEIQIHNESNSPTVPVSSDSSEPPPKRRKANHMQQWFKRALNKFTQDFFSYLESSETRFIDRVTCLEQERLKQNESMQKMWMEFEDRRRKEEREHELKIFSLLGQYVNKNGDH